MSPDDSSLTSFRVDADETKKRRREIGVIVSLGILFLILTWIEFRLFDISRSLPFVHSIFFFGLVNFNIILFLLLMFLIFRNIVKVFSEKQSGFVGSTLKGKLIAAFVGFSFVPTALMFLVSVFYINNSFDKWFSEKMAGVLKSSLEVTNAYYVSAKKKNYHFAHEIANELARSSQVRKLDSRLEALRERYSLDAVEFYPGLFGQRVVAISKEDVIPVVPAISLEFRQEGVGRRADSSTIHHFAEGNLVRVIVPAVVGGEKGAIVVSSFVPLSLIAKMDDIAAAYEDFRDTNPLAYPLKSIYLIILVLMTLVILLCATWFGFYLAKQLSIPLELLGEGARRVAKGDYRPVEAVSGSPEINQLVSDFNIMAHYLEKSEREVREANVHLRATLGQLDEHSRYIEVVLSNVSTGVVSVNEKGIISMVNRHAAQLLNIDPREYVGKSAKEVLNQEYYQIFQELIETMRKHKAQSIQKEVRVDVNGLPIPLQMTLSVLYDDAGRELGKVVVFNDLTPVVSAQRAAAWTEVARRIAHEIKNPLTPISLAAQRLQKKFGAEIKDAAFSECTNMIIQQVDDLKHLVNEFSQFARMPKSQPVMANLNRIVDEAIVLFRQAHKQVQFEFTPDPELPEFLFDPDQIKRAMTNLLDNAVAALENTAGGCVDIRATYDNMLKIVRISVGDNGPGIPRAMQDRIFEPYVTTKPHGTGLGLAIVKRTVEDHNGFVRALANQGGGTRIVIELPVIVANTRSQLVKALPAEEGQPI